MKRAFACLCALAFAACAFLAVAPPIAEPFVSAATVLTLDAAPLDVGDMLLRESVALAVAVALLIILAFAVLTSPAGMSRRPMIFGSFPRRHDPGWRPI